MRAELPPSSFAHVARWAWLPAVLLLVLLWRIGWETSLWTDETYSLLITKFTAREIVDFARLDTTPPGYHLVLKLWNKLGVWAGLPPTLFWSRLLGVAAWALAGGACWFVARRYAGARAGSLIACCMALGAQGAFVAKDLRVYALSVPAITLCLLALLAARRLAQARRLTCGCGGALALAYAACAATALWCHLLAGVALAVLAVLWAGLVWRAWRTGAPAGAWWRLLPWGVAAQGGALALFAPWVPHVVENLASRGGARAAWLTPPSFGNLLRVFADWYPLGQRALEPLPPGWHAPLLVLGALSAVLPLGAALLVAGLHRSVPTAAGERPLALLAAAGLGLALGNVLLVWGLDRYLGLAIFHGPRYLVHGAPAWALGLAATAAWAARRAGWPLRGAWLLLAPWLACCVIGQEAEMVRERQGGLAAALAEATAEPERCLPIPRDRATLYVTPAELIPYQALTLGCWRVAPLTELPQAAPTTGSLTILELNNWSALRRESDATLLALAEAGKLSRRAEVWRLPAAAAPWDQYRVWRLEQPDRAALAAWAARGFASNPVVPPPTGTHAVHPRALWLGDGWNELGVDGNGSATRWTRTRRARIRLPGPLEPGHYTLRVQGVRAPYPRERERMRFGLEGSGWKTRRKLPAGWNDLSLPLEVERRIEAPVLWLEHPIWHPNDYDPANMDGRPLGFLFAGLWLEPAN